jgi:hypothetical protein
MQVICIPGQEFIASHLHQPTSGIYPIYLFNVCLSYFVIYDLAFTFSPL